MSLREQLKPFAMDNHIEKYAEHNAKELEKIADRHAVDFGIWLSMWCELSRDRNGMYIYQMNWYTAKELLKIYKKEKGL
jgi:hypothetical protein